MLNHSIEPVEPTHGQAVTVSENKRDRWKSCCFTIDRQVTIFFSQLTVCIMVISFCMYQLIHSKSCERDQLYSSILTLILGVLIPQPTGLPRR
jgi:hypothetical protein